MKWDSNIVHHVCGIVRPENFTKALEQLSKSLQVSFSEPYEHHEAGIHSAIAWGAGIEILTPLSVEPDNPLIRNLDEQGERWVGVVFGVRNWEDVCARIDRMGSQLRAKYLDSLEVLPGWGERYARFEEACYEDAAFGGLTISLAAIETRDDEE